MTRQTVDPMAPLDRTTEGTAQMTIASELVFNAEPQMSVYASLETVFPRNQLVACDVPEERLLDVRLAWMTRPSAGLR